MESIEGPIGTAGSQMTYDLPTPSRPWYSAAGSASFDFTSPVSRQPPTSAGKQPMMVLI